MDTVSGELVAIKVVMRANQQRKKMMMRRAMSGLAMPEDPDEQFKREIAVMKKLSHPNVVQLIEVRNSGDGAVFFMLCLSENCCGVQVIDDPQEQKLMLVMEFVDGGVVDCQHPIKEDRARKLFQDAAKVGPEDVVRYSSMHIRLVADCLPYSPFKKAAMHNCCGSMRPMLMTIRMISCLLCLPYSQ